MPQHSENIASLEAHPNIRAAAEILRVSPSTLSRRADLVSQGRGDRDVVLAPAEVLRLGAIYRKRSLNDVAQDLLEQAGEVGSDDRRRVEEEVESYFEEHSVSAQRDELLRLARGMLPLALYEQIEVALSRPADDLPDGIEGYQPMADD